MNINEAYQFLNFISNKNQSGSITPLNFNISAKETQYEFFNREYKLWEVTQEITDNLAPFLEHTLLQVNDKGQAKYPADYIHTSSCGIMYNYKDWRGKQQSERREVKERNNSDFRNAIIDRISPPTLKYPINTQYADVIQFYPYNIQRVEFDYLRKPKAPYWDFSVVGKQITNFPTAGTSNIVLGKVKNTFTGTLNNVPFVFNKGDVFFGTVSNNVSFIIATGFQAAIDKFDFYEQATQRTGRPLFLEQGATQQIASNNFGNKVLSKSQDFEFPENVHKQIVFALGTLLGINLRENDFIQFSEMEKNSPTQQ